MGNDLISRSALIEKMEDTGVQITFDLPVEEILGEDVDMDDFAMLLQDAIQSYRKMVIDAIQNQPTAYNQDKVIHKIHCHYIDRIDDADSEETKKLQIDNHVVSEIVRNGGVSKGVMSMTEYGIKELKRRVKENKVLTFEETKYIIKAIELFQQYRAIGTVARFEQLSEQFKPHTTDKTSCPERHCNKCDKYRKENEKYHTIGTVEECRVAVERMKPKKVLYRKQHYGTPWLCPECEADQIKCEFFSEDGSEPQEKHTFCWKCGTVIDWGE